VLDVEILIPCHVECSATTQFIYDAAQRGVTATFRDPLNKRRGCVHGAAENRCASGVLEVTLWPQGCRAWFTVQNGRKAL
jgi:hypothetical protein